APAALRRRFTPARDCEVACEEVERLFARALAQPRWSRHAPAGSVSRLVFADGNAVPSERRALEQLRRLGHGDRARTASTRRRAAATRSGCAYRLPPTRKMVSAP